MNRIYKTREGAITAVEMAAERLERHILSVPTSMALKTAHVELIMAIRYFKEGK
jgi:hypothetical protein